MIIVVYNNFKAWRPKNYSKAEQSDLYKLIEKRNMDISHNNNSCERKIAFISKIIALLSELRLQLWVVRRECSPTNKLK